VVAVAACCLAQGNFRYFYDDANELFRVLDSSGTLIEYTYDLSGNITQVTRSTVAPASLAILNITPLSGTFGQNVTIYGQNFSATASGDVVQFGGVTATVISASSNALVVQIPSSFNTGQVTVTVNGVTATSGSLAFTPPPSITSISPAYGALGQTLTGVVIQGANLSGATFSLQGGGTVTPVIPGNNQVTANITLGQTPGIFVLIATGGSGPSSAQATAGDSFIVFNSAGNNYADTVFSVFNATGSTPNYPPGSNEIDQRFSVFNATGSTPNYPAGSNVLDQLFSVFNATGSTPNYPAGSNQAFQLFSTQNQSGSTPALQISAARAPGRSDLDSGPGDALPGARPPLRMIAGQSVTIAIQPSLWLRYLELDADGTALASSTAGQLRVPLTAPFGVDSFDLRAFGYTSSGSTSESLTETVRVSPDPGRTITGKVLDENGAPLPGALVTWQAQGLAAAFFRFDRELSAAPELRGAAAVRVSFLGALNYPNPHQIFGQDPMGVGLGKSYAVRLSGKIQADTAGLYQFSLQAHQGARLSIDGQAVVDAEASSAEAAIATGGVDLTVGAHDIEVTYFESGGAGALQLLWTPPGGIQAVVPPAAIRSEAPVLWRAVSGSDGRFVLHVPAALDGVTVQGIGGTGSVQVDR
jgi:YD repeat-containing protein